MDTNELMDLITQFQTMNKEFNGETDEELDSYINQLKNMYGESGEIINNLDVTTTKYINNSNNPDPTYAKEGDSGFDLRAYIDEPVTLKPLERKLIPTGLRFELSPNTELQVRPRSGMALKHGISVLNTPGTAPNAATRFDGYPLAQQGKAGLIFRITYIQYDGRTERVGLG